MPAALRHEASRGTGRFSARAAVVWAVLGMSSAPVGAQAARNVTPDTDDRIGAIFADFATPGSPGAAVVVTREGRIVYSRAFGLADVENGTPITTATAFRLASVTKQFTAVAILTLVQDRKLTLDDSLGDLLVDAPRYAGGVLVRHLLAHTSGLPDYEALLGSGEGPQLRDKDILALLHRAKALHFSPGTSWRYSNSAYALLALIVERVSGESFARYLRRRIFDRAGMPTAVAHEDGVDTVVHRAYGHSQERGGWRRTDQSRTSAVLGDGGIYASAEELARWSDALDRNAVLDAALFEEATTPAFLTSGEPTAYGFGWFLDTHRSHRRQRHEGDSIGFRTSIQRYPDDRLTVVVLVNRGAAAIDALSDAVADLFLGR